MILTIKRNIIELDGTINKIDDIIYMDYDEYSNMKNFLNIRYNEDNKLYQIFFKDHYIMSSMNKDGLVYAKDIEDLVNLITKTVYKQTISSINDAKVNLYLVECEVKTMEGLEIYKKSYEKICNTEKLCCLDEVTINFSDFDAITAGKLREKIQETLNVRKKEIQKVIFRAE